MLFRQSSHRPLLLAVSLAACAMSPAIASAAPTSARPFDGRWSVEVITDQGTCDRAYRWSLGVHDGRVTDMADNVATASGTIDKRGRLAMRFVRGQDTLTAKGSLEGENGSGSWVAPSKQCSGRWRAEKRG